MKFRLLLLPVIVMLLTGCRRDPYMQVYVDNMNAEKRLLEDTLYDLQYDYDTKVDEVEKLRKELEDLKSDGSSVLSPGGSSGSSSSQEPRNLFPEIPDLNIEQGVPSDSAPKGNDSNTIEDDGEMDDLEPPKLDLGTGEVSAIPMPLDRQVTSLFVNGAHTGGLQKDERPGDDGITVVFEPRNGDGAFVPVPGPVSVVLLDPETRQRVARWEFTTKQMEVALQQARAGRGIELDLPWQDAPPSKSRLHLFVRYWLADGKTVQADSEISVTPNGQLAARWTPRTEQRPVPPGRRVSIADNQEAPTADSRSSASESARPVGNSAPDPAGTAPARQAGLPRWRPYR